MKGICTIALMMSMVAVALPKQQEVRVVKMKVTAYCPCEKCCGKGAKGITSTGKDAYKTRGVAVAPKLIRYGTKLNIPGIGQLCANDTGGEMRKDAEKGICHIDILFCPTDRSKEALKKAHEEARKFGVKWLNVEVLK